MQQIDFYNLGSEGLNTDIEPHLLPPEAWSGLRNVRCSKRGIERISGEEQVFGTLSVTAEFIINIPSPTQSFWIYTSLTKAYVYDGSVHTNITRQTAAVDVNYTVADGYKWHGTILGGIPILNNGADVPQFWGAFLTSTKLIALTNWPTTLRAKKLIAFGPYLFALNLNDNGTLLPQTIQWSTSADPGALPSSWDYTNPIVTAGRLELTDIDGGEILTAELLGNKLIVYKQSSIHSIRFVGGNSIFSPELLLATSGALTSKSMTAFDKGTKHFVVTLNDVITHAGEKTSMSIAEDKVKKAIFDEIDSVYYYKAFAFDNAKAKEVWFCFPASGSTKPNRAAIWNYKDNTWVIREFNANSVDFGPISSADSGEWDADTGTWESDTTPWSNTSLEKIVAINPVSNKALTIDTGLTFDGSSYVSFVERTGLAFDRKDRSGALKANFGTRKLCSRIWPKITGTGIVSIKIGSQQYQKDAIVWAPTQLFNPAVDTFLDFTVNGRLLGIHIESTDNNFWQLQGYDLEISILSNL